MFDLINGIPLHPLVVHAVVVLLPLAVVGAIVIAAIPRWRAKYGLLVVAFAVIATVLLPVATSSGESLEKRVGDPGNHARLGDQLIWFTIPLLVLIVALVLLDRRDDRRARATDASSDTSSTHCARGSSTSDGKSTSMTRRNRSKGSTVTTVVAMLAVVAALVAGVQVYRVGDSGARAAWGERSGVAAPDNGSGRG